MEEKRSMDDKISKEELIKALEDVKVPLLVLDEKWHHLFLGIPKSEELVQCEKRVNELLKLQGKLNQELKDLKKVKQTLMNAIVDNMDEKSDEKIRRKKMDENKRLIDEVNEKKEDIEEQLLDLPRVLDEANKQLMVYSMDICYRKLQSNAVEIEEIGNWIKRIRVELKRNILLKQAHEIKNEEIYSYMHDILGHRAIDIFDLKYEEDGEVLD